MNTRDIALLAKLNGGVRHFDADGDVNDVVMRAPANKMAMAALKGNPPFIGQFNLNVKLLYFTVAGGVFTQRTAAYVLANAPTLATKFGLPIFSQADFNSGYANTLSGFPLALWAYGVPFIYRGGGQYPITSAGVLDATANALLEQGELVLPCSATVAGPVTYVALVVIQCDEVQYGTLLASLGSDMFSINDIRYTLTDTSTASLAQYRNQLKVQKQTFLGQFTSDKVPVNAMKNPQQFQAGIVDIPVEYTIDKNIGFGTYVNYDQENSMSLGIFLSGINKLAA